jgi:transcriptional regulator with XRE-family HTH domain
MSTNHGTVDRINALLESRDMLWNELSSKIGLVTGQASVLKRKSQTPSNTDLVKIARYFNVSVDYLLGRTDNPLPFNPAYNNISKTIKKDTDNKRKVFLYKVATKLSDEQLEFIDRYRTYNRYDDE